jgi:hypothetical protein
LILQSLFQYLQLLFVIALPESSKIKCQEKNDKFVSK